MIKITDARDRILNHIQTLGLERVPLQNARGRVLKEDIIATRQQPPWDNSAMDGYAVRAADVCGADEKPVDLQICEEIFAGDLPKIEVKAGQAARIFTGAPLPPGADAIIRQEDTERLSAREVRINISVDVGKDIRRAGEDQQIGDALLSQGKVIRAAEIGLLAGNRRTYVQVIRKPRVALLSTGDELCEPDMPGHGGQIVNTNVYALASQVEEAGGIPTILPIAADDRDALKAALEEALRADVLISSGGVSVGEHDFVKDVLESLGVEMNFWKIRMTPGKPVAFGLFRGKPVFGLPGNPVSSMVTFEVFVRPALRKMMGHRDIYRQCVKATLAHDAKKKGLPHFLRVNLRHDGEGWIASTTGAQGSGILRSMSLADALAFAPGTERFVKAGTEVHVMGLDGRLGTSQTRPF